MIYPLFKKWSKIFVSAQDTRFKKWSKIFVSARDPPFIFQTPIIIVVILYQLEAYFHK
jgi:hypothetical protein